MKKWILRRKVRQAFGDNQRQRNFYSFDSMKKILVLFESENIESVTQIASDLAKRGKEVILCTYNQDNLMASLNLGDQLKASLQILSKEDLSTFGVIKTDKLNEFRALQYDTLFCFLRWDESHLNVLHYLWGLNQSQFSVGIEQAGGYKALDLVIIKEDDNLLDTYEQIKRYANLLTPSKK